MRTNQVFKWIKQHLRITQFYGTTENAVKAQVWSAVNTYLLVAIVKKELQLDASLYNLLQILSVTVFEQISINQLPVDPSNTSNTDPGPKQLNLFYY